MSGRAARLFYLTSQQLCKLVWREDDYHNETVPLIYYRDTVDRLNRRRMIGGRLSGRGIYQKKRSDDDGKIFNEYCN